MTALRPGDVLAVRTPGLAASLIRAGEALSGKMDLDNHVVVAHHQDPQQRWWGLEGRPGGVGWADLSQYLRNRWTVNNCGQPGRTPEGRARVCDAAVHLLGTPYDWEAVADDALRAFRMADLWSANYDGAAPGHVVCSSFAAFLYEREGWDRPSPSGRDVEPGDWTAFCIVSGYSERYVYPLSAVGPPG